MEDLVSYSELGYSTYKELLKDRENMTIAITEIGQEVFDDILVIFEKKN
jgi:glycine cleavage system H lipoate-binding protein